MKGFQENKVISAPIDKSITTLFIGGVTDDSIREKDLMYFSI